MINCETCHSIEQKLSSAGRHSSGPAHHSPFVPMSLLDLRVHTCMPYCYHPVSSSPIPFFRPLPTLPPAPLLFAVPGRPAELLAVDRLDAGVAAGTGSVLSLDALTCTPAQPDKYPEGASLYSCARACMEVQWYKGHRPARRLCSAACCNGPQVHNSLRLSPRASDKAAVALRQVDPCFCGVQSAAEVACITRQLPWHSGSVAAVIRCMPIDGAKNGI